MSYGPNYGSSFRRIEAAPAMRSRWGHNTEDQRWCKGIPSRLPRCLSDSMHVRGQRGPIHCSMVHRFEVQPTLRHIDSQEAGP
jgi:hypothetical protein